MSKERNLDFVFANWVAGIRPKFTRQQHNRAERRKVRQELYWNFTHTSFL